MTDKILVIDDDPSAAELIKLILKPRGLQVYHALDGQEGLKQAFELQPDLIILDIMMPEHDGYEICSRVREFSDVPIIMLTAKSQSSDVTHGFAVGADDYVKKPFSNDELVSRIENLLRRKKANDASQNITSYADGFLEVEFASQMVKIQSDEVALTPTEFKLLTVLIRNPHKTLATRTLLTEVWGEPYSHDKALLSLYIHQLRQKLRDGEREHSYIKTQWGQGYWFNPLPQIPKTPESSPSLPDEEINLKKTSTNSFVNNWMWVFLVIPILLIILQIDNISGLFPQSIEESTVIDAIVTAEGFYRNSDAGVAGQVCLSNRGSYPTKNLSIVATVQMSGKQVGNFTTTSIDLGEKLSLAPNESHCYPYEILFDPLSESDAKYSNNVSVTITNYSGLEIGSTHCPGPDPCSFGPTTQTDFSFPEQ